MTDRLLIPADIHNRIMDTIGALPAESGGVFALKGNTVSSYHFDSEAGYGTRFYKPTAHRITETVNGWLLDGQQFGGFLHSHRPPYTRLSPMDVITGERTMAMNGLAVLYMGIVCEGMLYVYRLTFPPGENQAAVEPWDYEISCD